MVCMVASRVVVAVSLLPASWSLSSYGRQFVVVRCRVNPYRPLNWGLSTSDVSMNRWTFDDWRLVWRAKLGGRYGRTVVVAIIALLILGATFRAGIDRGMDQLVSWEGYGRILNAIAAVMTEQRFHQGGYALSNCIHSELERRGFTVDPEIVKRAGATVPQNLRANFLDKLPSRHRPTLRFNRRTMRPPRYLAMSTAGISFRLA